MEALWSQYEQCTNLQEKEIIWREILPKFIYDSCTVNQTFSSCTNFANELACRFLSAIYEQCSICEQQSDGLVQFLSEGYGCHLILALNFYSNKITSCCDELCNLLLSIAPLLLQGHRDTSDEDYEEFFKYKIDGEANKCFQFLSKILCKFPVSMEQSVTRSSSDDELIPYMRNDVYNKTFSEKELLENIKCISLCTKQVFVHLISSLLNLVQNNTIKEHANFVSYLEKCFSILQITSSTKQGEMYAWYNYLGIGLLVFTLLNELSSLKEGLSKINSNDFYSNIYNLIHIYTQKLSKPIYTYLSIDSIYNMLISLSYLQCTVPCFQNDLLILFTKVTQLDYTSLLKKTLLSFNDIGKNTIVGSSTSIERHSLQKAELALKVLVKTCKQIKCVKGYCEKGNAKQSLYPKPSRTHVSTKENTAKFQRKYVSSDEESSSRIQKAVVTTTNQGSDMESEESTKNVSDFNDFFEESSDSGVERKTVKEKGPSKQKLIEPQNNTKEYCFISNAIHSLRDSLVLIKDQHQIQLAILNSMAHIGICKCIDLDSFLVPIVSSLSGREEKIIDKSLSLICFLLSSNWEIIHQKRPCKRRLSSRHRTRSRASGATTTQISREEEEEEEENSDVDSRSLDNIFSNKPVSFQFLTKFKSYLKSEEETVLKHLLLQHLKSMVGKMPLRMQQELFSNILLPNFLEMFPTGMGINKTNIQTTMCTDPDVLKSYLELLRMCMMKSDDFCVLFFKVDGLDILHHLTMSEDHGIFTSTASLLDHLCHLDFSPSSSSNTMAKNKTSKSRNEEKETLLKIANSSISIVLDSSNTLLTQVLDQENIQTVFENVEHHVLDILQISMELLHHGKITSDTTLLLLKCRNLLDSLFEYVKISIPNIDEANIATPAIQPQTTFRIEEKVNIGLVWLKVLLPIQISNCSSKNDYEGVMLKLEETFLDSSVLQCEIGEQTFLSVLNACTICLAMFKGSDVSEKEDMKGTPDLSAEEHIDSLTARQTEEMEGYEADQDSDDISDCPTGSIHTHLLVVDQNKSSLSLITSTKSLLNTTKSLGGQSLLQIKHPSFIIKLLNSLAEKVRSNRQMLRILNMAANLIYEYQILDSYNNKCLHKEKLLLTIIGLYDFVFLEKNELGRDIQQTFSNIIVQLSNISIDHVELKRFLELFKLVGVDKKCLAQILWRISQIYNKQNGPTHFLVFPALIKESSKHVHPQSVKLQHRTQAFMVPKQEPVLRQSQLRSQSLSSLYEVRNSMIKPIGYSNQPSSWESSALQLPFEGTFSWPDKEFSLCVWYIVEDSGQVKLFGGKNSGNEVWKENRSRKSRKGSITLISQQSYECYGYEELYHLCSFGAANAMFEVWIGARTGYFQYRWIGYGHQAGEELVTLDQVVVQHHSQKNIWHQLIISLVHPSQSYTSEIVSFLDGCQMPSVQMKYPGRDVLNQQKLSLLIGHGLKGKDFEQSTFSKKGMHALKTGVFLVFQGNESFREQRVYKIATPHQPLIDKMKAVYLFYLGPNNADIDTDILEHFSNQNTSHMDSSLDWDSIMFKEHSFCMSVLSEKLVSDNFPTNLLYDIEMLTNMQLELRSTLMVAFNPRNYKQFTQFIPSNVRTSGNIQHTYLNDIISVEESKEAKVVDSLPFCQLNVDVLKSFKDAVYNCGGISILLYLHALIAEDKDSEEAQAAILSTIFTTQYTCPFLLREMNDLAGYVLIKRALQQSPCALNTFLIRTLLEAACDGDLFVLPEDCDKVAYDKAVVNQTTSAIVRNVCILQMLLKDWTLIRKADFEVQKILWQALESLVRPTHPNICFNIVQFQRARVVENLLMGCQDVQQEKYFHLPASISRLFIDVIRNLLGQPPDLAVLKAVCSFLIAIHPTLETLTLHSAQNFYLIAKTNITSTTNVPLRNTQNRLPKAERDRRTASCGEADLGKSPTGSIISTMSPQVIISQEDLTSHSIFQSEVIIQRGSNTSHNDFINSLDLNGHQILCEEQLGLDEIDSVKKSFISKENMIKKTPTISLKNKGHRRIQSDGNIRPSSIALDIPAPKSTTIPKTLITMESQDYDIISDSEFASSCEEGPEEYLVVDGFIDQKIESFTPTAKEERQLPGPDVLYHLRFGLMELIKNTLMLLPDNMVTRVFGATLKVEHLLVLVNQSSDRLREVALENLILYLQRGGRDCLANFNRFKGCHLLANQLHQHPVTLRILEACIALLVGKPLTLNYDTLHQFDILDENICVMAIVPCITLLEDSIQRPNIFGLFVTFLLKVFDRIEDLPLVAFEHGLADIVSNIIRGLANEESGSMMTSWKKESFHHLLFLLDWLVDKACCTCQTQYFQMYKDLQLSLENIEGRERDKKGAVCPLLSKTCRFLKYYLIQTALNVFMQNDLYIALTSKGNAEYIVSKAYDPSKSFIARNFIKKIRGSIQLLPQPTKATPTEIQERFQDILSEAVNLATLFNKNDHAADIFMFGHKLKRISGYIPGQTEGEEAKAVSGDADLEFCKDLLDWICNCIVIILSQNDNSSWYALLKSLKDDIFLQASRVIINFVSPLRSKDLRLYYVKKVMQYSDNKTVYQMLLLTNAPAKIRERYLACLYSVLSIPHTQLKEGEKEMLKIFKKILGRINLVKMNDQKLLTEMRERKIKRKDEETFKRIEAYKRIMERNIQLCGSIADHGMEVSKVIVEEQDRQRQKLLGVVRGKVSKDVEVRKTWRNLIHHITQERALWHCADSYPHSWQLDPTEGPFRMRKRLQRCNLEIAPKFFLGDSPAKKPISNRGSLSYLFVELPECEQPAFYSFKTNDTIRFLYHCKRVTPATKNSGEVLIGETHVYFVGDEIFTDDNVTQACSGDKDVISISWRYEEIHEILKRRYSLQDNALEIFLTSGRTFLLAFESLKSRDEVFEQLMSRELPNLVTATMDLNTLTNRWKEGHITNFEYLTELNKKAGRSFNDLMQYPVFPFILAEYENAILDLTSDRSFRNLSKPIACQDKGKEERYIENYEYLKADYEQRKEMEPENATPPYHYSSHYSNSGTVLHFLVRLPPFTSMFLKYQDNQFDIPDRTFHSMATTWKLSSFISNTDVKELIPEFFFLQEFLENGERYDMGFRQNKARVDHVNLPPWCKNDPRLFTLLHMQALESPKVSNNIHYWIDLVFGYKQCGQAAVKATNVFHPATYFGVDVSSIKDTIHRRALQTMIETYGQTPLQLFSQPHPKRFSKNIPTFIEMVTGNSVDSVLLNLQVKESPSSLKSEVIQLPESLSSPIDTAIGVQWGDYCGSPSHPAPVVQWVQAFSFSARRIITCAHSLSAYLCHANVCVLTQSKLNNVAKPIGVLSWDEHDLLLKVHSTNSQHKTKFNPMRPDQVTCCEYVPGLDVLFVGGTSGVLDVWPVQFTLAEPSLCIVGAKQNLLGHDDAITSICVCQPFSIAVTTSKDKTAIIWDLNRLCYIRSVTNHKSSVECVTVNESSGDIATACNEESCGHVYLWTINARPIGKIRVESNVNCLAFSSLPDGVAVNVVAAGMTNGMIRLWDTWSLQPLRTLIANNQNESVLSMAFSKWNPLHLFSSDDRGNVYLWTSKDIVVQKKPNFVLVSNAT